MSAKFRKTTRSLLGSLGLSCALILPAVTEAQQAPSDEGATVAGSDGPLRIVVTGTRTARTTTDTPVRTEVVTREELERTHARTLTEALEDVPGLLLRPIHGKAGYEASLQGLSGEQVLVLIDGLPISASTGSTVDLSQLALTDVERVEIVKGAMSAQYGSAAMGGVINVITRRIRPGFSGEVLGDLGTYGEQNPSGEENEAASRHGHMRLQGGSEQWRVALAADQRDSDGFDPDPTSWPQPGDQVDRQQADGRLEWYPSVDGRFYLQGGKFKEDARSRYQLVLPGQRVNQSLRETAERERLGGGASWRWGEGWQAQINGVGEDFSDRTLKLVGSTTFDDRRALLGLQHITTLLDWPMLGKHLFQVGADYHGENLTQSKDGSSELDDAGKVSRSSREVFFQDDIFLSERWELLPGLRYQDDSDFGGHSAPKLNLRGDVLQTADWQGAMRLGWGAGYRVPNLKERHFRFDHSQLGYVVIGNPDLQPEESSSWQLGWASTWRGELGLDVNLFHNRLRNLIQVDLANAQVVNGIQQFRYENIARAQTQGLELSANWRMRPRLSLSAAYTLLDTEDKTTGQDITRQPRHQARLGSDWQVLTHTSLSLRARHQSDELVSATTGARSPSFTVVDVSVNHDLTSKLRLFAGLDNVFNEQRDFTNPDDFSQLAGSFLYLGARYVWGDS